MKTQLAWMSVTPRRFVKGYFRKNERQTNDRHDKIIYYEWYHGENTYKLECGPMPNVMAALSNIGDALC